MFSKNRHKIHRKNLHFGSASNQPSPWKSSGLSNTLLFGLALLALVLLFLEKTENRQLTALRAKALDFAAPALELASIPAGYIQRSFDRVQSFYDINRKLSTLQKENKRLRRIESNIDKLAQNNKKLKALLNSAQDAPMKYVSGRIISGNPGLFGHHLLVNVGRRNGIHSGFAVINSSGFIGRTIHTGTRTSRILLLSDKTSRVPIIIGKQGVRGMATGTGSLFPKIDFLPQNSKIFEGDHVYTSGDGGELPSGLSIGVVKKINNQFHIALVADKKANEFVSVLYFDQSNLAENRR